MAEALQYGSRGLAIDEDGSWTTLHDPDHDSQPYTILSPDASASFESVASVPTEKRFMPGVSEERRFHREHPGIMIPNTLLREYLRQDHHLESKELDLNRADPAAHLVRSYARGPQYRLHPCAISVIGLAPTKLYVTLLTGTPVVAVSGGQEHRTHRPAFANSSVGVHVCESRIEQVRSCEGVPNPFFIVRTQTEVRCYRVEFNGPLKQVSWAINQVFFVDIRTLGGHRPSHCLLSFSDCITLRVASEDGALRVWQSERITSRTSVKPKFQLLRTMYGIPRAISSMIFCHIPTAYDDNMGAILLVADRSVELLDFINGTLVTIFTEQEETFLSLQYIDVNANDGLARYALLTDQRVVLVKLGDATSLSVELAWKHYRCPTSRLMLLSFVIEQDVHFLLYSKTNSACTAFCANLSSDLARSTQPYHRVTFSTHFFPTCMVTHTDLAPSVDELKLVGLLYVTPKGVLSSAVYSHDLHLTLQRIRTRKALGPALVEDSDSDEQTRVEAKFTRTPASNYKSIVDLSLWYDYLLSPPAQSKCAGSCLVDASHQLNYPIKLAYEVATGDQQEISDVDSRLESMVQASHENQTYAETTAGMRIYDYNGETLDSESYSAFAISRMMRAWKGDAVLAIGHRQGQKSCVESQITLATESLAMCTAIFNDKIENGTLPIRLANLCTTHKSKVKGKGLSRILDEWDLDSDPSDYVWKSVDSNHINEPFADETLHIPAFPRDEHLPPVLSSSQYLPPVWSSTQVPAFSSQGESQITMTQPVPGKYGDRKQKKRKRAGF